MAVDVVTALLSPASIPGVNSLPLSKIDDSESQQQQQQHQQQQESKAGGLMGYKKRVYCYACMLLFFSSILFALNLLFDLSSKLSENDKWWTFLSEMNKMKKYKNCSDDELNLKKEDCNVTTLFSKV